MLSFRLQICGTILLPTKKFYSRVMVTKQEFQIEHHHDGNTGAFFIARNGNRLAEMTYEEKSGKMIIDHTEVDESLRGRNIGFELVKEGVEYARNSNLKINPLCPFAKKVIDEHKELQDVL
jgi:predicted GNAT family acetyltransferase